MGMPYLHPTSSFHPLQRPFPSAEEVVNTDFIGVVELRSAVLLGIAISPKPSPKI
jgi:hypothetical protein